MFVGALWMMLAQAVSGGEVPPAPDIVVRGERAERALSNCLTRGCAVPDDVRLTMALAEAKFGQGRYRQARTALDRSIARNRHAADQYPRHVAALYEASATVNRHLGDMDAYRADIVGQAGVIRTNLAADDTQARILPILLGDSWLERGNRRQAMSSYDSARRRYVAQGETRLAAIAGLRRVAVYVMERDAGQAQRELAAIGTYGQNDPVVGAVRAVLTARIAALTGDDAAIDQLVATLRTGSNEPPMLLTTSPMPQSADMAAAEMRRTFGEPERGVWSSGGAPVRWVDVGYMVRPDGRVTDVEILRGTRSRGWADPYVQWIASRRYAPVTLAEGQPGVYRIERLTRRAKMETPAGSLVRQATGPMGVEILDLTRMETTKS
ncbi:hypothetical protein NZL82_07750 [Sphingomonas sanguinis]|uniref:hypothetical protein n=1 Tax=Sphingomonas sp. LC-1 TaxID=3110957 RepID=UPI0021BAAB42|nr:hypothetical protein [Sphingomonas sp. LC-1]MCT8001773.1 hypothetical protein [Sphingomonas sp. LC-1]